jgi:hypothetical protein
MYSEQRRRQIRPNNETHRQRRCQKFIFWSEVAFEQRSCTRVQRAAQKANSPKQWIYGSAVERVKGIEPSYAAWEAAVLPLNYTR